MQDDPDFVGEPVNADADHLKRLLDRSRRIMIKKVSNNDRDWARFPNKHQAGVYIPQAVRDGGFFPTLGVKHRSDPDADEIREVFIQTVWPQFGGQSKKSRLVHYTSKGQETHLTGLPKPAFAELLPASWLVMGRAAPDAQSYECLTIDSGSDEAAFLRDLCALGPDFLIGEFTPYDLIRLERDRSLEFVDEIIAAWQKGRIAAFAAERAQMPSTTDLARLAQEAFLARHPGTTLDPFQLAAPGDTLRSLSREIEWGMFRELQRRERTLGLIRIVLGDTPENLNPADIIRCLVDRYPEVDALMLSASQQRKSRAGSSFEHHIEAMLVAGAIPFQKQVTIEAQKRPDFILPSLTALIASDGLILSAKTTLRERWKQVITETKRRRLYLTTVDENIAGNAIDDMASMDVTLVVPESLLRSKNSEYDNRRNVMTFRRFCTDVLSEKLSAWRATD